MLLEKKVALVTGGSNGIGKAIALEMAREGADVVVNYNNSKEKAYEVARSVKALGRRSLVVKADVSNQKEVAAMRKAVLAEVGEGVPIVTFPDGLGLGIRVDESAVTKHLIATPISLRKDA